MSRALSSKGFTAISYSRFDNISIGGYRLDEVVLPVITEQREECIMQAALIRT